MSTTVVHAPLRTRAGPLWLYVGVGTLGSLGTVLFGSVIGSIPRPHSYRWWLRLPNEGYTIAHVYFYLSVALLVLAWLGVGIHALHGRLTLAWSWITLALWGLPLFLGVPIFGRDIYSYIAQGELAHHGFNPYLVAPSALGHGLIFSSIAFVWEHTTSPYGPLFVMLTHLCATIAGPSLLVQVLVFRFLELIGIVLVMVSVPSIAKHFHVDAGVALWLGVLSPLALFSAISSAHNDTLMIGLMVAAVAVALHGSRRWALVLFGLAASIKLPAAAGIVMYTAALWSNSSHQQRRRLLGEAIVIPGVVITAITELTGYGWTWLGPTALRIPTELRVLTTPVVSVGAFLASILHAVGITAATHTVVTYTQYFGELVAVATIIWLVVHTRSNNTVRLLGAVLLLVVLGSPTVWPWYYLWGLSMLALTTAQRSVLLAIVGGGAMLLVGPGGTPMIGGDGFYVTGPVVIVGVLLYCLGGYWRKSIEGLDRAQ